MYKCPKCRYQPVIKRKDGEWYCPECGWQSTNG
jgi:ribosomal protein L37AE/L43A